MFSLLSTYAGNHSALLCAYSVSAFSSPDVRPFDFKLSTFNCSSLALPPVTSHQSQITKSFRIRTYGKCAANPFIIRTSKTQHLKPFRIRTYRKTPGGRHPYQE